MIKGEGDYQLYGGECLISHKMEWLGRFEKNGLISCVRGIVRKTERMRL